MKIFESKDGINYIRSGQMIPTETVVNMPDFHLIENRKAIGTLIESKGLTEWSFSLSANDVVYGLGQNMRGLNKRGFVYESFCSDDPNHTPDKRSLYGAHNFFVVLGEENWGLYIDFAGKVTYDIGFEDKNQLKITIEGVDFDAYVFKGTFESITKQFRALIGPSYVPPKWAFGYQQSRWSYEDATVVKEIADRFDSEDIPCDAIYLDIDYMERFKDFTISDERFPEFKSFVKDLKARDLKLVPIIDAGVKVEEGYSVYEEGVEKHYFVTDDKGKPFSAAVWPGKVHFPDFLNADVREWFGNAYHEMLEMGIEGFWNDMNEPAIFYSEKGLNEAIAFVSAQAGQNLDIYTFFTLKDKIMGLSNALSDYKAMWHRMTTPSGELKVNHYDVHNLYGYNMTRAAAEGFKRFDSDRRFFMLTRASHIGMAKHSGIWTGDNHSWWEHLKLNVQMMPSLSMAGFLYSGADTGGFGGNVSAELMVRWMQFSTFTPLLRNHSAMGTRRQEPWQFDQATLKIIRDQIRMRYALVPYLYAEFMKANQDQTLLFAPLAYAYGDSRSLLVEDQVLFGEGLMLAPVIEQNALGRYVYLPEDMVLWKASSVENLNQESFVKIEHGDHYLPLAINESAVFIRKNHLLVLTEPRNRVSKLSYDHLTVIGYVEDEATYDLYDDDGVTNQFEKGIHHKTRLTVVRVGETYRLSVDTTVTTLGNIELYIIDKNGKTHHLKQEKGVL